MASVPGTLYVVATPIGNLADLAPRVRDVLARVALVAAEDTRRTGQLLTHLGLRKPLVSLHEHNESSRVEGLLDRLRAGEDLALVSDAGTPLVSDPGYRLLAAVREAGLRASPVPGPSALLAALSVAGLPTDRFRFEGFLSPRAFARRSQLERLAGATETLVFFETARRIQGTLADCALAFGPERPAAVARELTKLHETLYRGTLAEIATLLAADPGGGRGELTLIVAGSPAQAGPQSAEIRRVYAVLAGALPPGKAAALTAAITGTSRRAVYALARLSASEQ